MNADQHQQAVKASIDAAAIFPLISAWMGWMPLTLNVLGSVAALVWYALQIWESKTVQAWRKRSRVGH